MNRDIVSISNEYEEYAVSYDEFGSYTPPTELPNYPVYEYPVDNPLPTYPVLEPYIAPVHTPIDNPVYYPPTDLPNYPVYEQPVYNPLPTPELPSFPVIEPYIEPVPTPVDNPVYYPPTDLPNYPVYEQPADNPLPTPPDLPTSELITDVVPVGVNVIDELEPVDWVVMPPVGGSGGVSNPSDGGGMIKTDFEVNPVDESQQNASQQPKSIIITVLTIVSTLLTIVYLYKRFKK